MEVSLRVSPRREYSRAYYLKNRERILAQSASYREAHKDLVAEKAKAYSKANPDLVKRFQKNSALKRKFGITIEQYEQLLAEQNGVCALCVNACVTGVKLAVDHCHRTGKVRGLLCLKCNVGLGIYEKFNTPDVHAYLARSREQPVTGYVRLGGAREDNGDVMCSW